MPSETKAAKAYLGYEWSAAKGDEGIKYIGANSAANEDEDNALSRNKGIESIKTPLFNNSNLFDANKLNSLVRLNFSGALSDIPESLKPFTKQICLVDMLDFDAVTFDKQFRTSTTTVAEITLSSKFPLESLGTIAPYVSERVPFADIVVTSYISTDNMLQDCQGVKMYNGTPNIATVVRYKKDDILVSNIRPYLKKLWLADKEGGCSPDVLVFRVADTQKVLSSFLRYILQQETFFSFMMAGKTGVKMPRGNKEIIPNYKVPVPPLAIQKKVVVECGKVDEEYNTSRMTIDEYRARITKVFSDLEVIIAQNGGYKRLGDICEPPMYGASVAAKEGNPQTDYRYIRITDIDDYGDLNNDWKTAEMIENKYILKDGDVLFARSGATAGKTFLYRAEVGKAIYAGYLIKFTPREEMILPRYLIAFTHSATYLEWAKNIRGGTAQPNINAQQYSNLLIPVPTLDEQKKIVAEVVKYEAEIAKAKAVMDSASIRKQAILRKYGVIVKRKFTRDYTFGSPSGASSAILGRSSNGYADWKTKGKQKLADFRE